jgi:hypothetical protein
MFVGLNINVAYKLRCCLSKEEIAEGEVLNG